MDDLLARVHGGFEMPRYLLLVSERHAVTYLVEGEGAEQIEEAWDRGEVRQAVRVDDNFIANDIVNIVEEANWSPLEEAWAKRVPHSTASASFS